MRDKKYHCRPSKRRFANHFLSIKYRDKDKNAVTITPEGEKPIKKTDQMWVPFKVAAYLFNCSHQTIRLMWADGNVRAVQYPNTCMMVWLPDVQFFEIDDDDRYLMEQKEPGI